MAYQRGRYYYRSRREGGRVVTEYLGSGDLGRLAAELDARDQIRRRDERLKLQEQKQFQERLDDCVDVTGDLIRAIADGVLLCEGYHTHKGQWRKARLPRNQ